jgi:hypothetical protein
VVEVEETSRERRLRKIKSMFVNWALGRTILKRIISTTIT